MLIKNDCAVVRSFVDGRENWETKLILALRFLSSHSFMSFSTKFINLHKYFYSSLQFIVFEIHTVIEEVEL